MRIREAVLADAPAIARVHVESWRTTYCGIVADDYLAKLSYEGRTKMWVRSLSQPEGRSFHFVVEDASCRIVGIASGGAERSGDPEFSGELYGIYILEGHQRLGIGRRLVHAIVERLAHAGFHSMLVWVLAANASRGFYEALGGQLVRSGSVEISGAVFDKVAYGWRELRMIGET